MKLLEVAKRGSGRQVVMQFTMSEVISIIAMFETLDPDHEGYRKEKVMKAQLKKVLTVIEQSLKNNRDFKTSVSPEGKIFYENKEGEVDSIQSFINERTGDSIQ